MLESDASSSSTEYIGFSLEKRYGVKLHIDRSDACFETDAITSIDVETDEKDNFVGMAICQNPNEVFYYSKQDGNWPPFTRIIGHNFKSDLHWLYKWGIEVPVENVHMDTMIMSYVMNPTKESHGLKVIAKELLNLDWPSYRDIVGKGRSKCTLDKQPVELVANYCGMDAIATYCIYQTMLRRIGPGALGILRNLEMPIMRLLFRMERHGLTLDVPYLNELSTKFKGEIKEYEEELLKIVGKEDFNPRSPKQILQACRGLGIVVDKTDKRALTPFQDHRFVSTLFKHRGVSKLNSTYVSKYLGASSLPKVYPDFSQVSVDESADEWKGIRTGRLSSDFHNIPRRSEEGKLLRRLFVATEGMRVICGDYSQIEYRLLAHFSKEPMLLEAYKNGRDVHEDTAKMFGSTNRDIGKTLNFAAIYGAHAKKISLTSGLPVDEAQRLLDLYWKNLRRVSSWVQRIHFEARQRKGIRTILGRFIPIPAVTSQNPFERFHAERQAVNYVIQGSAADIIKLAMLRCNEAGYFPTLQVHDELLFLNDPVKYETIKAAGRIKEIMESVIKLDVPLEVDMGYGKNWDEAKG